MFLGRTISRLGVVSRTVGMCYVRVAFLTCPSLRLDGLPPFGGSGALTTSGELALAMLGSSEGAFDGTLP